MRQIRVIAAPVHNFVHDELCGSLAKLDTIRLSQLCLEVLKMDVIDLAAGDFPHCQFLIVKQSL